MITIMVPERQEDTMNSFPLAAAHSDLDEQIRTLRGTKAGRAGAARVTIARYPDFRVHLITLGAGVSIPWHANPGQVSVRCVAGLIRIHTPGGEYQLPSGEFLMLGPGVAHDVEALRESALVVAIARSDADVPALFGSGRWVAPSQSAAHAGLEGRETVRSEGRTRPIATGRDDRQSTSV